jgi:isocitrate dehydrogenase kinase/phosphatase
MDTWQQAKLHYIGLLVDHHQPELAETFFNSVTTKLLHRSYFRNDFIFVRPAVSTEYIENDEPGRHADLPRLLPDARDAARHADAHRHQLPARVRVRGPGRATSATCTQAMDAELLGELQAAHQLPDPGAVQPVLPQQGRLRGGQDHQRLAEMPFALPILHGPDAGLVIDAALFGEDDLLLIFSFRPRLLHGRHGGAQRLCARSCAR